MNIRRYRGETDVALLQTFNAEAIAETDGCGYLHPGDIAHRLFNGNKLFDPADVLSIWEEDGSVMAWVLASPHHAGYEAQVRPDRRDPESERTVLEYAEAETRRLMRREGSERSRLEAESFRCDTLRAGILRDLGWSPDGEPPYVLNRVFLGDVPEPQVPGGYTIRAVRGVEEAAVLGDVHAASFGPTWTPEMYRAVMESPGYAPE